MKRWLPACAWALVIFALSSIPSPEEIVRTPEHVDKAIHLAEYVILGLLVFRWFYRPEAREETSPSPAFRGEGPPRIPRGEGPPRVPTLVLAFLACCAFGIADECHQLLVEGRTFDVWDIWTNIAGVFVSQVLLVNPKVFNFTIVK